MSRRRPKAGRLTFNRSHAMKKAASGLVVTAFALMAVSVGVASQAKQPPVKWPDVLKRDTAWYGSDEARRIADNVLLYQRDTGGWPKNIDMATALSDADRDALLKQKTEVDSTIDNGATYTQLKYLARVYSAHPDDRYKQTFVNGIEYLLRSQYPNGGWPQFYPLHKGYYTHITYNDDAMIGVLELLRDVAKKKPPYSFVDDALRVRASAAVERGIECILKTQVPVDGKLTVWCAQHDEATFKPAAARAFEPVSLSGLESVGIVRFLMKIEHPSQRVIDAIESAVAWFEKTRINGYRWQETPTAAGFDRKLIRDASGGPLWARFYEIGSNRPIFAGRDSVIRYDVSQIEAERRNGYRWYTDDPEKLLKTDYPIWRAKLSAPAQLTKP
jgi:PelA/Pel-15E family pectate lyase